MPQVLQHSCPTHHLILDFKAEGISKGGNRFNAFYACPKGKKDCGYTENIEEKQGHFLSMQAEFRRAKEIAFFNANNAAVELVTKQAIFGAMNLEQTQESLREWRDWFISEWSEWYKREIMEITEDGK